MKCIFIVTQLELAGAQNALCALAKGLSKRGHEIVIVGLYEKNCPVNKFSARAKVPVINLDMKRDGGGTVGNLFRGVLGFIKLTQLLRRKRPDVVLTFTRYANWLGPIAAALCGIKTCITSQRNSWRDAGALFYWVDRTVANSRWVHLMTAVSEQTRKFCIEIEGVHPEKVYTIRNGVEQKRFETSLSIDDRNDLKHSLGVKSHEFIILVVARFYEQKGHRFLIQAIATIENQLPDHVRIVLVGDGPLKECLEKQIVEEAEVNRFIFSGVRNDIPEILAASDLFVLPSLHEGMPNVVLEAMASGVPVIATAVDGALEIIDHGEDGCLIPVEDPDALGREIIRLVSDNDLRNKYIKNGLKKIEEEFDQERVNDRYERLFKDCVNANTGR